MRLAAAVALAAPLAVHAAGLGRLSVLSSLGSTLNAEIEIVSLQPGEADSLVARLASAEAFRQAGVEPSAALNSLRFAIVRRDGKPVIRVTSLQPINEPFVDLLVELEGNTGRLVREYTFLLDPPGYSASQAIAAAPAGAPAVPATTQRSSAPQAQPLPSDEPKPRAATPVQEAPPAAPARVERPAAMAPAGASTYEVKRGDTLGEIARANLPSGVSLNQMLIAIYRANQDAFIRENINLVRAGRILTLPLAEEVGRVNPEEAARLVQSHRAEWNDYRSRLAAQPLPAEPASGQRAVSGKIEAGAAAAPAASSQQDQVRLAQADPAKPGAAAARAARADDAAAGQRALREAQSRVSDLEKNVADLQKLLELKNQQLAELEKKAAAKPAAKPEAKAEALKPEPAKPAPAPLAEAPKPAPVPAPIEAKKADPAPTQAPTPAPAPAPEAKKAEPAPAAKKAEPVKKAAPPAPPPSLLDEFLQNQIALYGAVAIVVLLLGYALWSWRRKKATQAKFSDSVIGAGTAPSLNDVAGSDASAGSQASVSQASGLEAEEVDPIAEADVYMAYGRDAQAEEILKEALQKDPNRLPVHAKLLEIYAKRNDVQAFEQAALKVKSLTNGAGAEWDKAVALGRSIDPANSLYGGSGASAGMMAAGAGAAAVAAAAAPSVDFDIGGGGFPSMMSTDIPLDEQPKPAAPSTIDFDLGTGTHSFGAKAPDPEATVAAVDFDLNAPDKKEPPLAAAAPQASGIDFDLNLDLGDKPADADKMPTMDLSSISLDLGAAGDGTASSNDPKWQEVATKLDLAKAYEEMGDKDGARELLGEVMKDGDATQKGQAQQLLTKLG